jgi:hypothetical protein
LWISFGLTRKTDGWWGLFEIQKWTRGTNIFKEYLIVTIRKLEVQFLFLHILQDFLLNWIFLGLGILHACFEEIFAEWDYYGGH